MKNILCIYGEFGYIEEHIEVNKTVLISSSKPWSMSMIYTLKHSIISDVHVITYVRFMRLDRRYLERMPQWSPDQANCGADSGSPRPYTSVLLTI